MDARLVHEQPGDDRERDQQVPGGAEAAAQQGEQHQRHHGREQERQLQLVGVEDGDDDDGQQVVDDRQGEQERAQRRRQVRADDREHGEGEGDVRGGGDRPAAQGVGAAGEVDQRVEQRRHGHAADRGDDRDRGLAWVAQRAGEELPLELQPHDEEEDRQQPVPGPRRQRQVQVEADRTEDEVAVVGHERAQRLVDVPHRKVRPDHGDHGSDEEERATHGLGPQRVTDDGVLGLLELGEELVLQRPRRRLVGGHTRQPSGG